MEKNFELKDGTDFSKWTDPTVSIYNIEAKDLPPEAVRKTAEALFKWERSMRFPDPEPEGYQVPRVNLIIKELPYESRKEFLSAALDDENCIDSNLLFNIYGLIKRYNTFSPDYFSSRMIFMNTAEEFLDMSEDLSDKLEAFRKNLIMWTFSAIRSCGVTESFSEKPVIIPFSYQLVLFLTDFISLSNMLKGETEIPGKLHLVGNADSIVLSLSKKCVTMYDMIEKIGR